MHGLSYSGNYKIISMYSTKYKTSLCKTNTVILFLFCCFPDNLFKCLSTIYTDLYIQSKRKARLITPLGERTLTKYSKVKIVLMHWSLTYRQKGKIQ